MEIIFYLFRWRADLGFGEKNFRFRRVRTFYFEI